MIGWVVVGVRRRGRALAVALALALAATVHACVTLEVPLRPDDAYPPDWGPIGSLGEQCRAIEGNYLNEGTLVSAGRPPRPSAITAVLETLNTGKIVSISVTARGFDRERGALVGVRIVPDGNADAARERRGCACVSETLVCAPAGATPGGMAVPGLGASKNNVLLSIARDGSLVAKVQGFQVSSMFDKPVFDITRSWARFERTAR